MHEYFLLKYGDINCLGDINKGIQLLSWEILSCGILSEGILAGVLAGGGLVVGC